MQKQRQYPVLLFSPGLGAVAEFYSGLLEDLASRGYVVVAINHPHISGVTVLPGGRVVPMLAALEEDETRLASAAPVVVDDLRTTLDWLQRQNQDPKHLLGGHLDLNRIGALGHSFGGSAALQAARVDKRLRAAANLDGTIQGSLAGPWNKPLLLYSAGNDPQDASMDQVWAVHRGPGVRKVLGNAGHHDFTDGRWVLPGPVVEEMGRCSAASTAAWRCVPCAWTSVSSLHVMWPIHSLEGIMNRFKNRPLGRFCVWGEASWAK